jgi:hypothetical protein
MNLIPLKDYIAAVVTVGLLVGIILLAVLGQECPDILQSGFTLALGWIFRGGAQLQNELRHQNRSNDNGQPPSG